jgi:hypothetical protein
MYTFTEKAIKNIKDNRSLDIMLVSPSFLYHQLDFIKLCCEINNLCLQKLHEFFKLNNLNSFKDFEDRYHDYDLLRELIIFMKLNDFYSFSNGSYEEKAYYSIKLRKPIDALKITDNNGDALYKRYYPKK